MKRLLTHFMLVWMIGFITLSLSGTASAAAPALPYDPSLAPMLSKVMPAVVNVRGILKITDIGILRLLEKQRREQIENQGSAPNGNTLNSIGSGVIIDAAKGYVVTNAHVIKDAQTVIVTLSDSRHFTAKVIGMDTASDVALLQIKATDLTAAPLADSNNIKVGDYVAAIGNPFGLNQSVSSGIISALGRSTLGIENFESFIQTDAPINPGNSGGALINLKGELIGINTAILGPNQVSIGIGFAIPSNMVKSVVDQLLKYGDVKRGMLGIGAQDITPDLAAAFKIKIDKGAAVTQVLPGSPAAIAGFEVGDVILSVNGVTTKNASDVVNTVGFLRVDSKINVEVMRNNNKTTLNVVLSDSKQREKNIEKVDPYLYGLTMSNFSAISPIHGLVRGVLVMDVSQDSNAWQSDMRSGDIITSVNLHPITNADELKNFVVGGSKELLIHVIRGPSALFLILNRGGE